MGQWSIKRIQNPSTDYGTFIMGIVSSWLSESFPPKSNFSVDDIPDLSGQVFIVTGGSSGLGKATTKVLSYLLQHASCLDQADWWITGIAAT